MNLSDCICTCRLQRGYMHPLTLLYNDHWSGRITLFKSRDTSIRHRHLGPISRRILNSGPVDCPFNLINHLENNNAPFLTVREIHSNLVDFCYVVAIPLQAGVVSLVSNNLQPGLQPRGCRRNFPKKGSKTPTPTVCKKSLNSGVNATFREFRGTKRLGRYSSVLAFNLRNANSPPLSKLSHLIMLTFRSLNDLDSTEGTVSLIDGTLF